jgi:hypothetical protein
MAFPTIMIENQEVSRMVCGSNTFFGYSHFSAAKDHWLREYFTIEKIVEVMARFADHGINCVCSGPEPKMHKAIQSLEKQTGWHMKWFCTPSGATEAELLEGIRYTADLGAEFCLPHTCYTDLRILPAENRITEMDKPIELIRQLGMIPGLSTHRPEAIITGDKGGYDLQVYIQPFNPIGFLCGVETDWMTRIIRGTTKTVLCIKAMAAGRVLPPTGIPFVYNNCKDNDILAVGCLSPGEVDEDVALGLGAITATKTEQQLTYSRSKQIYKTSPA